MESEGFEDAFNQFQGREYVCVGLDLRTQIRNFNNKSVEEKIEYINEKQDDYYLAPDEVGFLRMDGGVEANRALHVNFCLDHIREKESDDDEASDSSGANKLADLKEKFNG